MPSRILVRSSRFFGVAGEANCFESQVETDIIVSLFEGLRVWVWVPGPTILKKIELFLMRCGLPPVRILLSCYTEHILFMCVGSLFTWTLLCLWCWRV